MRILALRLKRFAGYYAAVTTGAVDDAEIAAAIELIARLNVPQINPLLLSLFDRCERKWFGREQFLSALRLLESYLFRRVACGCENESLAPFTLPGAPSLAASLSVAVKRSSTLAPLRFVSAKKPPSSPAQAIL